MSSRLEICSAINHGHLESGVLQMFSSQKSEKTLGHSLNQFLVAEILETTNNKPLPQQL